LEILGRSAEAKEAFAKAIGIDSIASEGAMLKVTNARPPDIGRGIARIDPTTFKEKGWKEGDVIIIQGKKRTATLVWPGYPEDKTKGIIRIDGNIRDNAGVDVEDFVLVRINQAVPAEYVVFAPTVPLRITGGEEYLKKYMEGRAIARGDTIQISVMGRRIDLMAVEISPNNEAVVMGEHTKVKIRQEPAIMDKNSQ
jgi:transitional endoplasmic reticulum ATPase